MSCMCRLGVHRCSFVLYTLSPSVADQQIAASMPFTAWILTETMLAEKNSSEKLLQKTECKAHLCTELAYLAPPETQICSALQTKSEYPFALGIFLSEGAVSLKMIILFLNLKSRTVYKLLPCNYPTMTITHF